MDYSRIYKLIRKIASLLFLAYFAYLLYRMFFFAYGQYYRFPENEIRFNLVPFKTIGSYIIGIRKYKLDVWFFNLFGNILAFVPMGFLLPIIFNKIRSFKNIAAVVFIISSVLEVTQFLFRLGTTDIDDVILNTLGGLMGFMLLGLCRRMLVQRTKEEG